jgi:hypothetical protein
MGNIGRTFMLQRNADDKERLRVRLQRKIQQARRMRHDALARVPVVKVAPSASTVPSPPKTHPEQQPPPPNTPA